MDSRRRAAIHARLPILTAPYAHMMRETFGEWGCKSPDDIDGILLQHGDNQHLVDGMLTAHRNFVSLDAFNTLTERCIGPPVAFCAVCSKQPSPSDLVTTLPCCGQCVHVRCVVGARRALPCACSEPAAWDALHSQTYGRDQ